MLQLNAEVNATNFDGWFWCVDSRFFKTASSQPWIFFALYFSFISFVCFRHIFFNIFFQHCLPPFFVVRPEMRSNSFFSYNSFLMFFLCANICVMNARWSSLNVPFYDALKESKWFFLSFLKSAQKRINNQFIESIQ